jgi:hydrogenase/urease accessory protein HupE
MPRFSNPHAEDVIIYIYSVLSLGYLLSLYELAKLFKSAVLKEVMAIVSGVAAGSVVAVSSPPATAVVSSDDRRLATAMSAAAAVVVGIMWALLAPDFGITM